MAKTDDELVRAAKILGDSIPDEKRMNTILKFLCGWSLEGGLGLSSTCDGDVPQPFFDSIHRILRPFYLPHANWLVCDDDLMDSTSRYRCMSGLATRRIPGKGIGVVFDITTDTITGLPVMVLQRRKGQHPQLNLLILLSNSTRMELTHEVI